MKRPPRVPTWVVAVFSALVLGGAVALFVAGDSKDAPPAKTDASDSTARDDSELVLPKDGGGVTTDARRRGEAGRARIATPNIDAAASDTNATASQVTAVLRGAKVTLVAADALAPAVRAPAATTRVGSVAVPCAAPTTSTAARTEERAVLDALTTELRAAGAIVTRLDDASGVAPCGPLRVAQFERSAVTLVLASATTPGAEVGVASARVAGALTAPDIAAAAKLVDALVSATGLPALPQVNGPVLRLLASFAVVDLPKGGSSAWIVLPTDGDSLDTSHRLTLALAGFLTPVTVVTARPQPAPGAGMTTKPAGSPPVPAEKSSSTDASSDN